MASGGSVRNLIDAVRAKKDRLEREPPEIARALAGSLVTILESTVPVDTGTLLAAITEKSEPVQIGNLWRVGVGNLDRLGGYPPHKAPGGTIAAFLRDHLRDYEEELYERGEADYRQRMAALEAERAQRVERQRARRQRATERQFSLFKKRLRKINRRLDALDKAIYNLEKKLSDLIARWHEREAKGLITYEIDIKTGRKAPKKKTDIGLIRRREWYERRLRSLRDRRDKLEERYWGLWESYRDWRSGR